MSEHAKHTPGPWLWLTDIGRGVLKPQSLVNSERMVVLKPDLTLDREGEVFIALKISDADCHLINAAPELLENLQYIDYAIGELPEDSYDPEDVIQLSITVQGARDLRAALTKAKGGVS